MRLMLFDNAPVFQNRQEKKTIANFCVAAFHFDLSFNVEGLPIACINWLTYQIQE